MLWKSNTFTTDRGALDLTHTHTHTPNPASSLRAAWNSSGYLEDSTVFLLGQDEMCVCADCYYSWQCSYDPAGLVLTVYTTDLNVFIQTQNIFFMWIHSAVKCAKRSGLIGQGHIWSHLSDCQLWQEKCTDRSWKMLRSTWSVLGPRNFAARNQGWKLARATSQMLVKYASGFIYQPKIIILIYYVAGRFWNPWLTTADNNNLKYFRFLYLHLYSPSPCLPKSHLFVRRSLDKQDPKIMQEYSPNVLHSLPRIAPTGEMVLLNLYPCTTVPLHSIYCHITKPMSCRCWIELK